MSKKNRTGIRPLNPARDLGPLANLIENAFGEELSEGGARVLREIRLLGYLGPLSYLFTGMGSEVDGIFTGFVYERDGKVVGNVTVNRPTGHAHRWQISNVAVLEGCRGLGIGHKLVKEAIGLVSSRGGHVAYLFVRDDNLPALRLYRGLGFVEVDRITDLKLGPTPVQSERAQLRVCRPLHFDQGQTLYELVRRSEGPGRYWLYPIRRSQYVLSSEKRLSRLFQSLFTCEFESRWGTIEEGALGAAAILRTTCLWNLRPHRLQLWVHPNRRGHIEEALVQDLISILSRRSQRPTYLSLPACEARAITAFLESGFRKIRTLILMRLAL